MARSDGERANYFLCLQIQDENLVGKFTEGQRQIIKMYPFYKDYIINKNGFHVTLGVLNLKTNVDVRTAATAMERMSDQVRDDMRKIRPLYFQGLGNFGTKTVFVKVECTPAFRDLIEDIATKLRDASVHVLPYDFVPHLTLFKVPKSVSQTPAPPNLQSFNDLEFGSQPMDNVHLCKMGTLTKTSTFYTTVASILLQE